MTTTDKNGLLQFDSQDVIKPIESTFNALSSSVSGAFDAEMRTFRVANQSQRDSLALQPGRTPTAANPLTVWRTDVKAFETNDGTGWKRWYASDQLTPVSTDITSLCTAGAGFSLPGPVTATVSGKTCVIHCDAIKPPAITMNATGNIANLEMLTLPAAYRPLGFPSLAVGSSGRLIGGYISPLGVAVLGSLGGTSNVATSETWSFASTYILA